MVCVVDVGNTDTCIGFFENTQLIRTMRFPTANTDNESVLADCLESAATVDRIIISSVVERANEPWRKAISGLGLPPPLFVTSALRFGFIWGIDSPGKIGSDRIANAQYAVNFCKLPAVVIDIGTATTFDVVSVDKVFQGGIITSGPRLWLSSFEARFPHLPPPEMDPTDVVCGKNTDEALRTGFHTGYLAMLEGLVNRLEKELGTTLSICITGGMGWLFPLPKSTYQPEATMKGVYQIHLLNQN